MNILRKISALLILITFFPIISCVDDESKGKQSIKKEKISGFVQKGPYIRGTSILMSELSPGLTQSGKVFTSQISNDQGLFEILNIELSSSFVEFTASGFYFNEVIGEISSAPLTLTSIANLSNKSSININVLTHLEKKRVENLIKSGSSFNEAKKKAKSEVLSIFSIVLETNSDFEDYDITKNTEEGAALLAISIILQGNRSVGQLTELISKIQGDISMDGKVDDISLVSLLRNTTFEIDLVDVRKKIESRNRSLDISTSIPDFEKYILKFLDLKNLNIAIEGEGIVKEELVINPSGRDFPFGSSVKLTPVPKEGWVFETWKGDISGNENPKIIKIDAPKNITAKFKRKNYPLNITIIGQGSVVEEVVSNPGGKEYPYQTTVKLTPVTVDGWIFESWGGDLIGMESPKTIIVNGPKNVVAKFIQGCLSNLAGTYEFEGGQNFCGKVFTGTTTWTEDPSVKGSYIVSDGTFGSWEACYPDSWGSGVVKINDDCGKLTMSGKDKYGDSYSMTVLNSTPLELKFEWKSTYGEFGIVSVKSNPGKPWPQLR
jgi:hypothetical protein